MKFSVVYFIRLFLRHLWLIVAVPLVMAVTVFFLTRDEPKTYISKTTVYTSLASGSSVDISGFTVNTVNTQFDNLIGIIKSNVTLQKTGLSLLASHLQLQKADPMLIQQDHYEAFTKSIPPEVKKLAVPGKFDQTLVNLNKQYESSNDNFVYQLVNRTPGYYNASSILGKLSVRRVQNSDNIELSYESDDPGICQQTLIYLVKVYKQAYIVQKAGQSDNAVAYFEAEVARASEQLQNAENELLEFNKANKIINYNEQSKFIAGRKEQFEMGYQEVIKQQASSKAVIDMLETKMTPGIKRRLAGTELIGLRKELGKVNQELAALQTLTDEEDKGVMNRSKFQSLTQKSFDLKTRMHGVVDSLYELTNGSTGVPEKNVVSDWLSSIIDYEGTTAQIATMDRMRLEFDKIYSEYAPMGAMMRRLERKINVAEDEYISLVKNLGLAKLKQQSVEVSSANTILDPPRYPSEPQPGKRKILILAAAVIGLLVTLLIILILDLTDSTLRNTGRAADVTGLEVESMFPLIRRRNQLVDPGVLEKKSVEALSRKLILRSIAAGKTGPVFILFFSTQGAEGKSFLLQRLASELGRSGYKVLALLPGTTGEYTAEGFDAVRYTVTSDFYRVAGLGELDIRENRPGLEKYHFIFMEFPALLDSSFPVNLLRTADCSYLVCRANRRWSKADEGILREITTVTAPAKSRLLLNGVEPEEMESLLGELPRKRSKIRVAVKKIVTRQYRTNLLA